MIDFNVPVKTAAIKDSTSISKPRVSSNSNSQGSLCGQMLQDSILVILGQRFKSSEGGKWLGVLGIKVAGSGSSEISRCVSVISFSSQTKELDIRVSKLWDGSTATSGSSALEWVGCAWSQLLGGKLSQSSTVDLDVTLNGVNYKIRNESLNLPNIEFQQFRDKIRQATVLRFSLIAEFLFWKLTIGD